MLWAVGVFLAELLGEAVFVEAVAACFSPFFAGVPVLDCCISKGEEYQGRRFGSGFFSEVAALVSPQVICRSAIGFAIEKATARLNGRMSFNWFCTSAPRLSAPWGAMDSAIFGRHEPFCEDSVMRRLNNDDSRRLTLGWGFGKKTQANP